MARIHDEITSRIAVLTGKRNTLADQLARIDERLARLRAFEAHLPAMTQDEMRGATLLIDKD